MFRDHKSRPPVHLATNNKTLPVLQSPGDLLATAQPGLLYGLTYSKRESMGTMAQ